MPIGGPMISSMIKVPGSNIRADGENVDATYYKKDGTYHASGEEIPPGGEMTGKSGARETTVRTRRRRRVSATQDPAAAYEKLQNAAAVYEHITQNDNYQQPNLYTSPDNDTSFSQQGNNNENYNCVSDFHNNPSSYFSYSKADSVCIDMEDVESHPITPPSHSRTCTLNSYYTIV